jgi:hypothetical protein
MFYAAAIFYHISPVDQSEVIYLWEESIVLINAENEEDARFEAERIGHGHVSEYENANGVMVRTEFFCVQRIFQILNDITSGTEIFSRFLRDSEATSLLSPFDD